MAITLRAARVNAGYTQEEASQLLGVSVAIISRWENGTTIPGLKNVNKLCELYKVDYHDINFFTT